MFFYTYRRINESKYINFDIVSSLRIVKLLNHTFVFVLSLGREFYRVNALFAPAQIPKLSKYHQTFWNPPKSYLWIFVCSFNCETSLVTQ